MTPVVRAAFVAVFWLLMTGELLWALALYKHRYMRRAVLIPFTVLSAFRAFLASILVLVASSLEEAGSVVFFVSLLGGALGFVIAFPAWFRMTRDFHTGKLGEDSSGMGLPDGKARSEDVQE